MWELIKPVGSPLPVYIAIPLCSLFLYYGFDWEGREIFLTMMGHLIGAGWMHYELLPRIK